MFFQKRPLRNIFNKDFSTKRINFENLKLKYILLTSTFKLKIEREYLHKVLNMMIKAVHN